MSTHPTTFRRVTRSAASGGDRFVFFACGRGEERWLVARTPAGAASWDLRLDQLNENMALTEDAGGRWLFARPPEPSLPTHQFDVKTGRRLGRADPWPLCYSAISDVGLFRSTEAEAGVYRRVSVASFGGEERFQLGPVFEGGHGFAMTPDGTRVVLPDGRGAAVVCVVPEVMRQLEELGLAGR